jgi:Tfp pilus assembly protein PilV
MTRRTRQRGFTIAEAVIAGAVLAVGISGASVAWVGVYNNYQAANLATVAGQIGRAEVERAKIYGVNNLPLGTYSSTTQEGTWQGSFDPTSNTWVTGTSTSDYVIGGLAYYDNKGNRVTSSTAAGVSFYTTMYITDDTVAPTTGTGYVLTNTSRRSLEIDVYSLPSNTMVESFGTEMVMGGV